MLKPLELILLINCFVSSWNPIPCQGQVSVNESGWIAREFLNVKYGLWPSFEQDRQGLIWIGVHGGGVYRSDGYNEKHFIHNPKDTSSLGQDWVRDLAVDSAGNVWLGLVGFGIDKFNPKTEKFVHYRPDSTILSQINNFYLRSIRFISDTLLLVEVQGNYLVFDLLQEEYQILDWPSELPFVREGYQLISTRVYLDRSGLLWFHAEKGEKTYLIEWEFDQRSFRSLELPSDLSFDIHYHLNIDSERNIWLNLRDQVAFLTKDKSEGWQFFSLASQNIKSSRIFDVDEIPEEPGAYFIYGDWELLKFDLNTQTFLPVVNWAEQVRASEFGGVFDRDGNYWVACRYFSDYVFYTISKREASIHSIETATVSKGFLEIQAEEYLIGTGRGFTIYKDGRIEGLYGSYRNLAKYENQSIMDLQRDKDGWIVFSLFTDHKFCRFNPGSGQTEEYPINSSAILSFDQDDQGTFWLGTWTGLARLDINTDSLQILTGTEDCPECLPVNTIRAIQVDHNNRVWIGTTGNGLFMYDPQKSVFKNLQHRFGDFQSLSNNGVTYILEDTNNRLWIGTKSGLNLYNADEGIFQWILVEDGLPDNDIRLIQEDQSQQIWVGTAAGLSSIGEDLSAKVVFNRLDKVGDFASGANYCDKQGRLFFGLPSSFFYFHPRSRPQLEWNAPLTLTHLKIKNKKITPGEPPQDQHISFRKEIQLAHHQNFFSIGYAALHYPNPEQLKYAYQLEGLNDDWQYVGHQLEASFTSVPPGNYTFRLKVEDGQGNWSSSEAELKISVLSPWYWSWWSKLLYWLIIILAIYSLYHFQLKRQLALAENLRLRELDQIKTRLYTNITHEFRTPLTIILGMADQAVKNPRDWLLEGSRMIKRNGNRLLHLINQMLDLSKLESGSMPLNLVNADIIGYLRYINESFHSYAEIKGISLHFLTTNHSYEMDFDPAKLLDIVSNLVSNAVKFSPEGSNVYMQVQVIQINNENFLEIRVTDFGVGMAEEELTKVFDRFYQTGEGNVRQSGGTGIGLALTKELVKLLDGQITVSSQKGKGSKFTVLLPVRQEAIKEERPSTQLVQSRLQPFADKAAFTSAEEVAPEKTNLPLLLIIEDNQDVVQYLIKCLDRDYQLVAASDGQSGIDKAIGLIPDIIISDVMMPEKDGFEVCKTLKADRRTNHIPIILLTAKADMKSKLEGLDQGADAYLPKPFNEKELNIRLRNLMELKMQLQQKYKNFTGHQDRNWDRRKPIEDEFLRNFRSLVEEHISDSDFGIVQLCQALQLSRSQLFRKLKALTGQSTSLHIRSIRLQKAKELLLSTDLNISEIAYDVGFSSPAYFTRSFVEEFGNPPSDVRE